MSDPTLIFAHQEIYQEHTDEDEASSEGRSASRSLYSYLSFLFGNANSVNVLEWLSGRDSKTFWLSFCLIGITLFSLL